MGEKENSDSLISINDILGIKPVGETGLLVAKSAIKGVSSFLSVVCKPGLEELGFLIKDRVRQWRLSNILRVLEKAKGKLSFDGKELNLYANPRVGLSIMECCSEVDNEELQDYWAGLFASSCTPEGKDDSNMVFVDLLRRMSSIEARFVDYACRNCKKIVFPNNLILADTLTVSFDELVRITGINDIYRLDSELDHMRSIELLLHSGMFVTGGGFTATDEQLDANLTPSPLALSLYYKTHCTGITPIEFWKDNIVSINNKDGLNET